MGDSRGPFCLQKNKNTVCSDLNLHLKATLSFLVVPCSSCAVQVTVQSPDVRTITISDVPFWATEDRTPSFLTSESARSCSVLYRSLRNSDKSHHVIIPSNPIWGLMSEQTIEFCLRHRPTDGCWRMCSPVHVSLNSSQLHKSFFGQWNDPSCFGMAGIVFVH